jgi:hypothetical protein
VFGVGYTLHGLLVDIDVAGGDYWLLRQVT